MVDRIKEIDVAKGIGIFLVVIGHSHLPIDKFIYWFHMPLFFIISGMLYKKQNNISDWFSLINKRFNKLLIPYFIFGSIIAIIIFLLTKDFLWLLKTLAKIIYGGRLLGAPFSVFWFVTVLFSTQIIYAIAQIKLSKKILLISLLISYLLAEIYSNIFFLRELAIPWNLDVVPIAVVYFGIGSFFKDNFGLVISKHKYQLLIILLTFIFIILQKVGLLNYELDMKNKIYNHFFLDIAIPLVFTLSIFIVSQYFKRINYLDIIFTYLGKISMFIMYLHWPVNFIFEILFEIKIDGIMFTVLGIAIPIIIYETVKSFSKFWELRLG